MNNYLKWIFSFIGGVFAVLYHKYALITFFVFIAIVFDVVTGIVGSKASGEKISSKKSWTGLWKKTALVFALFFGFFLDYFIPFVATSLNLNISTTAYFSMFFGCYIVLGESISILENLQKSNPDILPSWVLKLLTSTKEQIDKEEDNAKVD